MNAPRSSKVLGGVLLLSLALNLFLGGMLVSRFRQHAPGGSEPKVERMIDRMADTLAEADGRILREVYRAHQSEFDQLAADLQGARSEVRKALSTDPFDQQALQAAFARQRQRRQAIHEGIHGVLVEAAPRLSAEGRRRLSEWRREPR